MQNSSSLLMTSRSKPSRMKHMLAALQIVTDHFRGLHFQLNEGKTQFWVTGVTQQQHYIQVNGIPVQAQNHISILGWDFTPFTTRARGVHPFVKSIQEMATRTTCLPMSAQHKSNVIAGIFMAGLAYCPWACFLERQTDITAGRKYLLQAVTKHHLRGPRSSAILTLHALRGHQLDPQVAILYRMIRHIGGASEAVHNMVVTAHQHQLRPTSLCTSMAHGLRQLGGNLIRHEWHPPHGAPVPLRAPPRQQRSRSPAMVAALLATGSTRSGDRHSSPASSMSSLNSRGYNWILERLGIYTAHYQLEGRSHTSN